MISSFGNQCKTAIGIDLVNPEFGNNYIKADIKDLPFESQFADLITLRFVVEHLNTPKIYFNELSIVLKPGGKIIILTNNILSPLIFLPKIFLPHSFKNFLPTKIFKVHNKDVFPIYHQANSANKFKKIGCGLNVKQIQFISDLNYTRRWKFLLLLTGHLLTKPKSLNKFRINILVILEKI